MNRAYKFLVLASVAVATSWGCGSDEGSGGTNTVNGANTDGTADVSTSVVSLANPVSSSGELVWVVTLTNAGPNDAITVTLDGSPAPLGYTDPTVVFTSASPDNGTCSVADAQITCDLGDLAVGASVDVLVTASPSAAGPVRTQWTANHATQDPDEPNNITTDTTDAIDGDSDPAIVSVVSSATSGVAGMSHSYTVSATNNGPAAATDVDVVLTFDDPALASAIAASAPGAVCTPGSAGATCTVPALAVGATWSMTVDVTPTGAGTMSGSVTITSNGTADSDGTNNSATFSTPIAAGGTVDLVVSVTDAPDPVALGDNVTYTITVDNNGNMMATGVSVEHQFTVPANATFVPGDSTSGCTQAAAGQPVICAGGDIPAGGNAVFSLVFTANNVGQLMAMTGATSDQTDAAPGDNSTSSTTDVIAATGADMSVTITDTPDPVVNGETLTYTSTITNNGPQTATSPTMSIVLAQGLNNITATPDSGNCTVTGNVVACTFDSMPSGSSIPVTITATVDSQGGAALVSSAMVDASQDDANEANDTATVSTVVASGAGADMGVTITSAPNPVLSGQPLTYTVSFFNAGTAPAATAQGQFALGDLEYSSLNFISPGADESCTHNPVTNVVTCDFSTFPMGRIAVVEVVAVPGENTDAAPPGGGPYNYVATTAANVDVPSGDGVDGNEANDNALNQSTVFVCQTDNPCVSATLSSSNGAYACEFIDNDGATCGEACFADGICSAGSCQLGAPVDCGNDGNECTASACNPATGQCETTNLTGACVGNDLCVTGKMCVAGQCMGGAPVDCVDDGNSCTINTCNPATGACDFSNVSGSCDDSDPCTRNDQCVNGTCGGDPLVCDDGDPCTDDVCDPAVYGGCGYVPNTNPCDDGDPCTSGDQCQAGECAGSAVVCDDGNPCTDDVCDATLYGGCGNLNNTDACDDGDACTDNDICSAGSCNGSPKTCDDNNECTTDSCDTSGSCQHDPTPNVTCGAGVCVGDYCGELNLCDGVPTCSAAGQCEQTPVDCDDNNPCTTDSCDPATGACSHEAVDCSGQNTECATYTCNATDGQCMPMFSDVACDDDNDCTADTCEAGTCMNTATPDEPCSFGECTGADCETNLCDGEPTCNEAGECVQEAVNCDDNDPCTDDVCDPASGACSHVPVDCSNLNSECGTYACNPTDGACVATFADTACDDGNPCTTDTCDAATGACAHEQVDCTGQNTECINFICNEANGSCMPAEVPDACDDGNPCTDDACINGACQHVAVACDDGNACNGVESCHPTTGACVTDGELNCADDGNPCTDEFCDPIQGCVTFNNSNPCDDGSECTTGDQCTGGVCAPGQNLDCPDDGNPCTNEVCNPQDGCITVNNSNPCDDGSACTDNDYCMGGTCNAGAAVTCNDDGNPCTDVACDPAQGCVEVNHNRACDDGSACTNGDMCSGGVCIPGEGEECVDDGNPCTTEFCDPVDGCTVVFNAAPCDDGNVCTTGDACSAGVCQPGESANCTDDGNVCTDEICDPVDGCQHVPNTAPCDDDNACTTADTCSGGSCFGGPAAVCNDDGNVCTDTECDPGQGCVHINNSTGCDDGNACTSGDVCSGGSCAGDAPTSCDDGNACTTDSCHPTQGCRNTPNDDACDDGNPCTADSCDPAQGCVNTPQQGPCDDGNACNDTCSQFGPNVKKVWNMTNTKNGQGASGLWLHSFVTDGKILRMTIQPDSYFVWYNDNTATITGTASVTSLGGGGGNMGETWNIDLDLVYRGAGEAGEGSGGPKGINDDSVTDHWKYFDLQPSSRIRRAAAPSSDYLKLTQYPANSKHPFQVGNHANLHDAGFGAAVWYQWTRVTNGQHVRNGNGDLNVTLTDYDCVSDMCVAGQCVGGTGDDNCDDGNPCTDDSCDPQLGCVYTPNNGNACDDGNACTDNYCSHGVCEASNNDDVCNDGQSCNDACAEFPFTQAVKQAWKINNVSGGRIFWLPGFYGSGKALMSAEPGSYLVWLDDNTLRMWGTSKVVSLGGGAGTLGTTYNFEFTFNYRGKGSAGVGSGGPKAFDNSSDIANWEYFDMTSGRLELASSPNTHFATFTQRPANSVHPFQVGAGAGHVVADFGGATWIDWTHRAGNHTYTGTGDINMTLAHYNCQGVDYCSAGVCGDPDAMMCQ